MYLRIIWCLEYLYEIRIIFVAYVRKALCTLVVFLDIFVFSFFFVLSVCFGGLGFCLQADWNYCFHFLSCCVVSAQPIFSYWSLFYIFSRCGVC
jgi:hypothetical protein